MGHGTPSSAEGNPSLEGWGGVVPAAPFWVRSRSPTGCGCTSFTGRMPLREGPVTRQQLPPVIDDTREIVPAGYWRGPCLWPGAGFISHPPDHTSCKSTLSACSLPVIRSMRHNRRGADQREVLWNIKVSKSRELVPQEDSRTDTVLGQDGAAPTGPAGKRTAPGSPCKLLSRESGSCIDSSPPRPGIVLHEDTTRVEFPL